MDQRSNRSLLWIFPVMVAVGVGLAGGGLAGGAQGQTVALAGFILAIVSAAAWVVTLNLWPAVRTTLHLAEVLGSTNRKLQEVAGLLRQISEQQLISERAKAIAFREKEREAMRRAIREEINRKEWEAALVLAGEIESVLGYKAEADTVREEVQALRDAEMRRGVEDAILAIDRYCAAEDWTGAMREAESVMQRFPDDIQAQHLKEDVQAKRLMFKTKLMERWNDAIARHDVDGSIETLKKLDAYLTPEEADALAETARQVFKDKITMLGQQFGMAVKQRKWEEAIKLGDAICSEFPNSRMAQEVKQKMDLLRQMAAEPKGVLSAES